MYKKGVCYSALLALAAFFSVNADNEFRSPLVLSRGPAWYQLPPQDDGLWVIDSWGALYGRSADKAYVPNNDCSFNLSCCSSACCNNTVATLLEKDACGCASGGSTRHTEQLSSLFFGKSLFRIENAFAGGQLDPEQLPKSVPAISFSQLAPRFEYTEKGVICGIDVHRKFGDKRLWRLGVRARLPFKTISVDRKADCRLAESFEDVMNIDLYNTACSGGDSNSLRQTFAYRLDFLSSLAYPAISPCSGVQNEFVHYGTGGTNPCTDDVITIGGVAAGPAAPTDIPFVVFYNPNNCVPDAPKPVITIAGTLNADGTSYNDGTNNNPLVPGQWYTFDGTLDYASGLGLDRDAQSNLWIGPNFDPINPQPAASNVYEAVQFIMNTLDTLGKESSEYFLNSKCIFMRDYRIAGIGDLDTDVYVGYHADQNWYANGVIGIRYPTGKKNDDPGELLAITTGNNGHFEVKGAVEGGWNPIEYLAAQLYFSGSHVCSRTEKRAVPFEGATIRNIGPAIDVDISYNYFVGDLTFSFYHPSHKNIGGSVGYQLYARGKDKARCCRMACDGAECGCVAPVSEIAGGKATDLLGFQRPYDCTLFECGTDTMSHTLHADIFHRSNEGYFELFGGVSQIVGGRYAMRETEAHVGVTINF